MTILELLDKHADAIFGVVTVCSVMVFIYKMNKLDQ